MPVTDVTHDTSSGTLTIVADFAATPERVWEVYAQPRQLEQVWGPPTYPATFVDHDLSPGGLVTYFMTSPEGERYFGYWEVESVHSPTEFTFTDGFALDEHFTKNEDLPVSRCVYSFAEHEGGTRATYAATYDSPEALEQVLAMGAIQGSTLAINQIDTFLAG